MTAKAPLSILLTNIWLNEYAGSEVVVRDMALGLLRRGHRPVVYSPKLGRMASEIADYGIVVTDDLRTITDAPDIIHAHHCVPCGEALIRFPQTPAIFVCHAFGSWLEAPVHFPQIGIYVAVDEACRDRLRQEGIAPERIVLVPNAVDLRRIPPRPQSLSATPQRAIAFGKASELPELRVACERQGIPFSAIGGSGHPMSVTPERELVRADIVFASARSAIEALCCGCAVVVCDRRGIAGLVTPDNFDAWRKDNFGMRTLLEAPTVDNCVEAIKCYDATAAAAVSERARHECDVEKAFDAYEAIYERVLADRQDQLIDPADHDRAVAKFLHDYLPRHPGDHRWPWLEERDQLLRVIASQQLKLDGVPLRSGNDDRTAAEERDTLVRTISSLQLELDTVRRSRLLRLGRFVRRLTGRDGAP